MATVIGAKRSADNKAVAETSAEEVLTKKRARKLRKQTPEQRAALEFRHKVEYCAKDGNARGALDLYRQMKVEHIAINTYVYRVIINVCANTTDSASLLKDAFEVYEDMKQSGSNTKSAVDESTYSALIKMSSKDGDFTASKELIAEMETNGISPKLRTFASLLQAYSDIGDLENCLWVHAKLATHSIEASETEYVALLRACVKTGNSDRFYAILDEYIDTVLQPGPSAWEVLKEWFASDAASVNGRKWKCTEGTVDENGFCSTTGKQLLSVELAPELQQELLDKIERLVRTDERRIEQWDEFKRWLDEFGPFDVVIDAANVGYYNQNFEGGGFNYRQIATILEYYEARGKRVLIILHKRRTLDEQVPEEHRAMVKTWRATNTMYNCLPGNNDDWYWLYAAVKLGGRTLMVSNDEMRDHHFQMIHNRSFVRWKERHQVHYEVGDVYAKMHEPSVYSARPQRIDDAWHFPSSVSPTQWLCVELETV